MRAREQLIFPILILTVAALLACNGIRIGGHKDPRDPVSMAEDVTGLYRLEIWSAHEQYELGEPVHLRATVTNLSKKELKAELETAPIINILIAYEVVPTETIAERAWSQEHPDAIQHTLALMPGESYVVEWTPTLQKRGKYVVGMCANNDASGLTTYKNRSCDLRIQIYYGVEKPEEPMP